MHAGKMAIAVGAGLMLAAVGATAQEMGGRPEHELGVDLALMYTKEGSGCATDCGFFTAATPVDLRIGFLTSGPLSVEPRLTFDYVAGSGAHALHTMPGVNVLYQIGTGSGHKGLMGPYLTAGAAIDIIDVGGGGVSGSATQPSVNVGIGDRVAWGTAAFRPEAFFRYNFENSGKGIASSFDVGVRVGISLFH